ncbi:hypothetical protein MBLNU230_g0754t1 [Neophaeotheca triangularis]
MIQRRAPRTPQPKRPQIPATRTTLISPPLKMAITDWETFFTWSLTVYRETNPGIPIIRPLPANFPTELQAEWRQRPNKTALAAALRELTEPNRRDRWLKTVNKYERELDRVLGDTLPGVVLDKVLKLFMRASVSGVRERFVSLKVKLERLKKEVGVLCGCLGGPGAEEGLAGSEMAMAWLRRLEERVDEGISGVLIALVRCQTALGEGSTVDLGNRAARGVDLEAREGELEEGEIVKPAGDQAEKLGTALQQSVSRAEAARLEADTALIRRGVPAGGLPAEPSADGLYNVSQSPWLVRKSAEAKKTARKRSADEMAAGPEDRGDDAAGGRPIAGMPRFGGTLKLPADKAQGLVLAAEKVLDEAPRTEARDPAAQDGPQEAADQVEGGRAADAGAAGAATAARVAVGAAPGGGDGDDDDDDDDDNDNDKGDKDRPDKGKDDRKKDGGDDDDARGGGGGDDGPEDGGGDDDPILAAWNIYLDWINSQAEVLSDQDLVAVYDLHEKIKGLIDRPNPDLLPPPFPPPDGRTVGDDMKEMKAKVLPLAWEQNIEPAWDIYILDKEEVMPGDQGVNGPLFAKFLKAKERKKLDDGLTPLEPPKSRSAAAGAAVPPEPEGVPAAAVPPGAGPVSPRRPGVQEMAEALGFGGANARDNRNWYFEGSLGSGGMGNAGLWITLDQNGRIADRCVVKDIHQNEKEWERPSNWVGEVGDRPMEYHAHKKIEEAAERADLDQIVKVFGYGVYPDRRMLRIYTEHCVQGDLTGVINLYRKLKGKADQDGIPLDIEARKVPEAFVWNVLESMTTAVCIMARGAGPQSWTYDDGEPYTEWDAFWLHLDVKPANIFLQSNAKDDTWPGLPQVKLGDFGLAINSTLNDQDNPRKMQGCGTRGFRAPEQRSPRADPTDTITPQSDIWAVGRVAECLMTLNAKPTDATWGQDLDRAREEYFNSYSGTLREIVDMCLSMEPSGRPTPPELDDVVRNWTMFQGDGGDGTLMRYRRGLYPDTKLRIAPDIYKDL